MIGTIRPVVSYILHVHHRIRVASQKAINEIDNYWHWHNRARAYEAAVEGSSISEGRYVVLLRPLGRLQANVATRRRTSRVAAFGHTEFSGSEVGGTSQGGHRTSPASLWRTK